MTHNQNVLWLLKIYGPCSVKELMKHTDMPRQQVIGALWRERQSGRVERFMQGGYRLTVAGREYLGRRSRPLLTMMSEAH